MRWFQKWEGVAVTGNIWGSTWLNECQYVIRVTWLRTIWGLVWSLWEERHDFSIKRQEKFHYSGQGKGENFQIKKDMSNRDQWLYPFSCATKTHKPSKNLVLEDDGRRPGNKRTLNVIIITRDFFFCILFCFCLSGT